MATLFKQKESPPPPPPSYYRDEIGGTEQIPVKNDDGTYTYITKRIPLTAEQMAEEQEYKSIMHDALAEIKKLSSADYDQSEQTPSILNAWESEKNQFVDGNFEERAEVEDKILAKRGLTSSSAGETARRRRIGDKHDAMAEVTREKGLIAGGIRNEKLALQQNLYNIAANRNDIEGARTMNSAVSGLSAVSSINAGNSASIADYYNRQLANNNSRLQNPAQAPQLFGQVAGAFFGGPVGATVGSSIGSNFNRY
ncbi:MAG: hypothetical protein ACI9TY_001787 [Alphaproteobacteria bacterium]|jgi:hypothetical protein